MSNLTIEYLELRHKKTNKILSVTGIPDYYTWVQMTYNQLGDITESDFDNIIDYLPTCKNRILDKKPFTIEAEAKDLPSIGDYILTIKQIEID